MVERREALIRCRGHGAIRATHNKTFEVTRDTEISERATCIIGVDAAYDVEPLQRLRGRIQIELAVDDHREVLTAVICPAADTSRSLIFRSTPGEQRDTFAHSASKSSRELSRDLAVALTRPDAELVVRLVEADEDVIGAAMLFVSPMPGDERMPAALQRILGTVDLVIAESSGAAQYLLGRVGLVRRVQARRRTTLDHLVGARALLVTDGSLEEQADAISLLNAALRAGIEVRPTGLNSRGLTALVALATQGPPWQIGGRLPTARRPRLQRLHEWAAGSAAVATTVAGDDASDALDLVALVYGDRPLGALLDTLERHRGPAAELAAWIGERARPPRRVTLVLPGGGDPLDAVTASPELTALLSALRRQGVSPKLLRRALQQSQGWTREQAHAAVEAIKPPESDGES